MKKNKMMRFASMLLVLTLLSTCAISGTFAKYTTSDSANDSARVAKWGVVVEASNGSNFKTEYGVEDQNYNEGSLSVKASDAAKVVAPGTKDATGITFKISGTPEVATKVDIDMDITNDVYLKAGTYLDWTTTGADDANSKNTFSLDEAYTPVVFTLKQTAGYITSEGKIIDASTVSGGVEVAKGTLIDVEKAIESAGQVYCAPNSKLDSTYVLTWEWAFSGNDKADTLLGNIAADSDTYAKSTTGVALTKATFTENSTSKLAEVTGDYDTDIAYNITFTVTQVD